LCGRRGITPAAHFCWVYIDLTGIRTLLRNRVGATAAEYALILGILGAAIAIAAFALGSAVSESMNMQSQQIETCGGGC
jgi:pilus assembly protein Flp/PilA